MPVELNTWLLSQGTFAGISALLLWHIVRIEAKHALEITALKTDLAAERTRNSELQESRLDESKVLVEVVQSNRATMQSLLEAFR